MILVAIRLRPVYDNTGSSCLQISKAHFSKAHLKMESQEAIIQLRADQDSHISEEK